MRGRLRQALKAVVPVAARDGVRALSRYMGSRHVAGGPLQCPLCGGNFSSFFPTGHDLPVLMEKRVIGAGYRLNASCPYCHSKERDRLIFLYLKQVCPWVFSEEITLLHVAPEPRLADKLRGARNISYVSADLNSPMADERMDTTDIQKPDNSFEVIICNHVLEHVEDDRKAMAEFFRLLKPGGFAILQVPISYLLDVTYEDFSIRDGDGRERAFGQNDHVRIYGQDYPRRLEQAGFIVSAVSPEEFLDAGSVTSYCLVPEEKLFIGAKG